MKQVDGSEKRGEIHMLAPTLVASARNVYEAIKREVEGEIRARLAAGDGADDQAKAMLEAKQASSVAGAEDAAPDTFAFHGKPMSGAVAVFFALQMCDKVGWRTLYSVLINGSRFQIACFQKLGRVIVITS